MDNAKFVYYAFHGTAQLAFVLLIVFLARHSEQLGLGFITPRVCNAFAIAVCVIGLVLSLLEKRLSNK